MASVIYRGQHMAAWKITEAACCQTRLAYNGIDPKTNHPRFDRAENVNIMGVEGAENIKMLTEAWNKYTHHWLKRCVYERIGAQHPAAQWVTYFVSAFWHGFQPGFYLGFLSGALVTVTARCMRRHIRPLFLGASPLSSLKWLYDLLGRLATAGTMSYMFYPFALREWNVSIELWKQTGFLGHLVCLGLLLAFDYVRMGYWLQKKLLGQVVSHSPVKAKVD